MKSAIAIGCLLLSVSSARAQFEFVEQARSVSAGARIDINDVHESDAETRSAMDFGLFDETVTASVQGGARTARATAWQYSNLTASEIIARGGPRDVLAEGADTNTRSAGAGSETRVLFRLDAPAFLQLHAEILDPPTYDNQGSLWASGDVSFSLTGPGLEIVRPPHSGVEFPPGIPAPMPEIFDQTHAVGPGDYLLDVSATYNFIRDLTYAEVYYDVRLVAVPIPEPNVLAPVLLALVILFALRCLCGRPLPIRTPNGPGTTPSIRLSTRVRPGCKTGGFQPFWKEAIPYLG
jgi:hypothetical protein